MKGRTIILNQEAKDKLKRGIDTLNDVVKVTLGPEGRTVIIANYNDNTTHITKDGVTVADQVFLSDPIENVGAQIVKQVASKQAEVGDGTTTSIVLAQALIELGLSQSIPNMLAFTKELEEAKNEVIKNLKLKVKKITPNSRLLESVATISANNDKYIGKLVSHAIKQTGIYGVVSAEAGQTSETHILLTQGMEFDTGFIAPQFITDLKKSTAELKDVCIFIYDGELRSHTDVNPLLKFAFDNKKSLLIMAEDVTGVAKDILLAAKLQGTINCVVVKNPSFGEYRKAILQDVATVTGGKVIESSKLRVFHDLQEGHYGFADSVTVDKDSTIIVGGKGKEEDIIIRIQQIQNQISATSNEFENKYMRQRISKLKGGVAVIKVGGYSELEIREKKDRIDDAICAAKAALEEGVVKGGGVAYLHARKDCKNDVLFNALIYPFHQILINAGVDKGERERIQNNISHDYEKGYDAKEKKNVDMFKTGIVDPMKVVRTALENAVSIAITFLTTEAIIVEHE